MQHGPVKLVGVMTLLTVILAAKLLAFEPANTAWQGHWQQNNQRSVPPRKSSASLQMDLEISGSVLKVHMHAKNGSHGDRKADVTYELGGAETVYTGTDGDEFHSRAQWAGDEIVFTVVEHEDGKLIPYTETWTLLDGGNSIQRVKLSGGRKTVTVLERAPIS